MYNQNKKFNNFKLINFIKSCKFFFFLMVKSNANIKLLKKFKNLIKNKLRFNKKTKNLLLNSISSYFLALITNSVLFIETKSFSNNINHLILNFIIAVRLNNKIYSKFCFHQFLNSYCYFQSKKLVYKLFVLRLKNINKK